MTGKRLGIAALGVASLAIVAAAMAIVLTGPTEPFDPRGAGATPVLAYITAGNDPFPDFRFDAVPAVGDRRVLVDIRDVGRGRVADARPVAGLDVSIGPHGWAAIPLASGPEDIPTQSLIVVDLFERRPSIELQLEWGYAWGPDGRLALFGGQGIRIVDLKDETTLEIRTDKASAGAWAADGSGFWGHMQDRVGRSVFIGLDGRIAERLVRPYSADGRIRLALNGDLVGMWESQDAQGGRRLVVGPQQDHGGPLGVREAWADWPMPGPVDGADARWDAAGTGMWVATTSHLLESALLHYRQPGLGREVATFPVGTDLQISGISPDDRQVILRAGADDGLRYFAVDTSTGKSRALGGQLAGIAEPTFAGFID